MRLYFDDELSWLICRGDFERTERLFLNRFLRTGDVFVDIGSNIGLFTLIAARQVGDIGHVYGFEPCPRAFQRLLANVELNRFAHVSCYQVALSDRQGEATLTAPRDGFAAWSSLAQPTMGSVFACETVPTISWDHFAQEHRLVGRVRMMKIDVEGSERLVLQGARNVLSRPDAPVLQVEFSDGASASAGSSCRQLYSTLTELGYQMYVYDGLKKRLVPEPLRESYPSLNMLAIKDLIEVGRRLARGAG